MSYNRRNSYRRPASGGGWRGPPALEILYDSITLSGASTFTEIEVSLLEEVGKLRFGRVKAMMIVGVEVDCSFWDDVLVAQDNLVMLQATSSEEGAEITLANKDLVFKVEPTWYMLTSGAAIIDESYCKWFPHGGIPYFKKRIWFGADSDNDAAKTINFRIYYYFKYLNKKQQTRIISQMQ